MGCSILDGSSHEVPNESIVFRYLVRYGIVKMAHRFYPAFIIPTSILLTFLLTLTRQPNLRPVQFESICRRQFKCSSNVDLYYCLGRKHCGEKEKMLVTRIFLLFAQCFQNASFPGSFKGGIVCYRVNPSQNNLAFYDLERKETFKIDCDQTRKCFFKPAFSPFRTMFCTIFKRNLFIKAKFDLSSANTFSKFNSAEVHLFSILSTTPQRALFKDALVQLKIVGISMRDKCC